METIGLATGLDLCDGNWDARKRESLNPIPSHRFGNETKWQLCRKWATFGGWPIDQICAAAAAANQRGESHAKRPRAERKSRPLSSQTESIFGRKLPTIESLNCCRSSSSSRQHNGANKLDSAANALLMAQLNGRIKPPPSASSKPVKIDLLCRCTGARRGHQ